MGLKNLTISMILIMFFVLAIVFFAVGIATDNSASRTVTDDDFISNLSKEISPLASDFKTDQDAGIQAYVDTPVITTGIGPQKESEIGAFTSFYLIPKRTFEVTMGFIRDSIFGGPADNSNDNPTFQFFFVVIGAFISTLFIIYVIRALRSGEVD